jgi:hypothetical protein
MDTLGVIISRPGGGLAAHPLRAAYAVAQLGGLFDSERDVAEVLGLEHHEGRSCDAFAWVRELCRDAFGVLVVTGLAAGGHGGSLRSGNRSGRPSKL